ncbi:MAG TPA: GNAT family N-acetyltransferase [Solirubrobacterales bacterium]|nr:GNAT family N-acetyltransferase [Solirubrobacterales bacterium]
MTAAVRVTDQLARATAESLGDGFHDDEVWTWLLPRRWQLRRVLPRYYEVLIRRVFVPRNAAWTTADAAGGALWFPPGTAEMSLDEQLRTGLAMLPEGVGSLRKGARWERLIHENLPREPHWRLNSLSVRTSMQRRGVGSVLIEPGLRLAEADGVGCYLETQRRANIPFYRRFGFEEAGEIGLPGSPPVWRMWRPA